MFENPRRGRQTRNFSTNVPRILDVKSSSEQIFSENCPWVPLYQRLIEKKASTPLKSQGKWLAEDSIENETVDWESTYSLPFWCTMKKQN